MWLLADVHPTSTCGTRKNPRRGLVNDRRPKGRRHRGIFSRRKKQLAALCQRHAQSSGTRFCSTENGSTMRNPRVGNGTAHARTFLRLQNPSNTFLPKFVPGENASSNVDDGDLAVAHVKDHVGAHAQTTASLMACMCHLEMVANAVKHVSVRNPVRVTDVALPSHAKSRCLFERLRPRSGIWVAIVHNNRRQDNTWGCARSMFCHGSQWSTTMSQTNVARRTGS